MRKKRVLYHSAYSMLKTGFSRNAKEVLKYLENTGEYDVMEFATGQKWDDPSFQNLPWKCTGTLPKNPREVEDFLNRQEPEKRKAFTELIRYGWFSIDKIIKEFKPDIYLGVEDIWGVDYTIDKSWFKQINSIIWTTLDSRPIHRTAKNRAKDISNFWVWSNFAEKDLHKMGHTHVKTMHGMIDHSKFYPLDPDKRKDLRKQFGIDDNYVIGFVFRNQLRKSVPQLLMAFKEFNQIVPNSKLLLHTCFEEGSNFGGNGWDILFYMEEFGIDPEKILCTYYCPVCRKYEISRYYGPNQDCNYCHTKSVKNTINIRHGVSEFQLNEIYNTMDVYCHPFTSGGQEIPIQEAKYAGLVTLVSNYSCGEEPCSDRESGTISIDWTPTFEPRTNFIKAATSPRSIVEKLMEVYSMSADFKGSLVEKSMKWVHENYSTDNVMKKVIQEFDKMPIIKKRVIVSDSNKANPNAFVSDIENDKEWILSLYKNILGRSVSANDDGVLHWMTKISQGTPRNEVERYFRDSAIQELNKKDVTKDDYVKSYIKNLDKKRILFVAPSGNAGMFSLTSLFPACVLTYPDYDIYVSSEENNLRMLVGNPYIKGTIPFIPEMKNSVWLEGYLSEDKLFDIVFQADEGLNEKTFLHNNEDQKQSCTK